MAGAAIVGPHACLKGLRHGFGIAAVAAANRGRARPRQPADNRGLHHRCGPRGTGFSGQDVGKRGEFGRIPCLKAPGEGP